MNIRLCFLLTSLYGIIVFIDDALAKTGKKYYDILGILPSASDREIKKAFRKLAIQYHPDKNKEKGAEDKFREIAQAYEVLSDPERKRKYDMFGDAGFEDGFTSEAPNSFHFNFEDIFQHFDNSQNFYSGPKHNRNRQNYESNGYKFSFNGGRFFNFDDVSSSNGAQEGSYKGFGRVDPFEEAFFSNSHFSQNKAHNHFQRNGHSGSVHCRTITQRIGNRVTSYTHCS